MQASQAAPPKLDAMAIRPIQPISKVAPAHAVHDMMRTVRGGRGLPARVVADMAEVCHDPHDETPLMGLDEVLLSHAMAQVEGFEPITHMRIIAFMHEASQSKPAPRFRRGPSKLRPGFRFAGGQGIGGGMANRSVR